MGCPLAPQPCCLDLPLVVRVAANHASKRAGGRASGRARGGRVGGRAESRRTCATKWGASRRPLRFTASCTLSSALATSPSASLSPSSSRPHTTTDVASAMPALSSSAELHGLDAELGGVRYLKPGGWMETKTCRS